MDMKFLVEIVKAVLRELLAFKKWVVGLFIVISLALLVLGEFWPERYESSVTLYADVTNIIQPLLAGRAEVTRIDRSREARELIYTRLLLKKVIKDIDGITFADGNPQHEELIKDLRENITILNLGKNYFRVTYSSTSQDKSFGVVNAVVSAFISETSENKRRESRGAFDFIDQQVITYKSQLVDAEEKLKKFRATNLDGTQASVASRIQTLRANIEEIKITIEEAGAQVVSLKEQLKNEGQYQSAKTELDGLIDRMSLLNRSLEQLRLSYQEGYPDIVELKDQIAALELVIAASKDEMGGGFSSSGNIENPLYEELRKNIATMELDLSRQKNRKNSMERMLESEYERAKRVAAREAELSELLRDNDVTRTIYEEMLGRKERARLSMTLDVEGQGVSYKIQEPAVFPLEPTGLRFIYFAIAAPLLGILLPIGLVVVYVLLDPRVRSPSMLVQSLPEDIEMLAIIPHINSPIAKRVMRRDIVMLGFVLLVSIMVYFSIVFVVLRGDI